MSASDDCTLRLWEPRTALKGRKPGGAEEDAATAGGAVVFAVHFCHGGKMVAAVGEDGALTLWDAGAGVVVRRPQRGGGAARPACSCVSPEGGLLAVGESDGIVRLWDLASGQLRARLKVGVGGVVLEWGEGVRRVGGRWGWDCVVDQQVGGCVCVGGEPVWAYGLLHMNTPLTPACASHTAVAASQRPTPNNHECAPAPRLPSSSPPAGPR